MSKPKTLSASQQMLIRHQVINKEQISRQYKQNVSQIYDTLTDLVDFSNELGDKVDSLLHHQQLGFFNAYRSHLTKIKENVVKLENKISWQEEKIKQYESEGTIALLLKKISKLESELNGLYETRVKLLSEIQEQKIKIEVIKSENNKMSQNIRELIKVRAPRQRLDKLRGESCSIQRQNSNKKEIFSTEVGKTVYIEKQRKGSLRDIFIKNPVENQKILRNKISFLTTQHHRLLKNSAQLNALHSQLSGFFLQCVETVKKQICIRRQIPSCKLSDFRKDDKVQILNLVLQNDQIITTVYNKLFNSQLNQSSIDFSSSQYSNLRQLSKRKTGSINISHHKALKRIQRTLTQH